MTHDYDVTLTYMVRVEAQDAADAERFAIEDVEHGRYDVRAVDTTERDSESGVEIVTDHHTAARVTFSQAVQEIGDLLDRLSNAPHEDFEGNGGRCPICGLVTKLRAAQREEFDALALREHQAAHPTPPSGPAPRWEKVETDGDLAPAKTTVFRKPDGSPLIEITLTHTFSKLTRVRRRRDG